MVYWLLMLTTLAISIAAIVFFYRDVVSLPYTRESFLVCGREVSNGTYDVCAFSNVSLPTNATCSTLNVTHEERVVNKPHTLTMLTVMFALDGIGAVLVVVGIFRTFFYWIIFIIFFFSYKNYCNPFRIRTLLTQSGSQLYEPIIL